jgi:tRNA pseudouridine38-40 synthase
MRIKATLAYDGTKFYGLQYQHNKKTVMGEIKQILARLKIESQILASGRTDRGVHAFAQVIHFDVPNFWTDLEKLKTILNRALYPNIFFKHLVQAKENFHAIHSAKRRAYRYLITPKHPSVFEANYITYEPNLNVEPIAKAIKLFEGRHDFDYFKKNGSNIAHFERTIYQAKIYPYKNIYVIYFEADGFVRSQVRMMVAFLFKIAKGELNEAQLRAQLACQKVYSSDLASPSGLYLAKVLY